jgi:hypothetical protein
MKFFLRIIAGGVYQEFPYNRPCKPLPQIAGERKTGACRRQNALLNCYALAISGKQIGYEKISA